MESSIASLAKRAIKFRHKTLSKSQHLVQKRDIHSTASSQRNSGPLADSRPYVSHASQHIRTPAEILHDVSQNWARRMNCDERWDECMEETTAENEKLRSELAQHGMEVPKEHVWAHTDDIEELKRRVVVVANENVDLKNRMASLERDNVE